MASSRRTYDTDFITLRTVYAQNSNNVKIPALYALVADGSGGTRWSIPSTLSTNPSFNQIITTGGTYTADLSFNTFRLFAGQGIGMVNGTPGSNETFIYAKAFNQIDISGADSLKSFSNGILTQSVKFATAENAYIQLRTDSDTNTLFIDGPMTQTISTGYYGFNKFVIIPSVSTIQTNLTAYPKNTLFADSQSTQITFAGVNDLILSTNYSTNQVFFTVSSFTAAGYLALSGETFSVYNRLISTISSGFVTVPNFSTGAINLSTLSFSNASSVNSSIFGVSTYFGGRFDFLNSLISTRATIEQLNTVTGNFQISISSFSTNYMSYTDYISSAAGILNQISTTLFLSGISTIYVYDGNLINFSVGSITYDQSDISTLSTATNSRIISTNTALSAQNEGNLLSTFSTVLGLGTLGYVSSTQLTSTTQGLGTIGYISTTQLTSTIAGLGTFGYISTAQLISTVAGLGTLGYISTSFTNNILQSTVTGINNNLGSLGYVSSSTLEASIQSTTQGLTNSLGTLGYVSTLSLQSTTQGLYDGFGNYYISTAGLNTIIQSSIEGLGTVGYLSTSQLNDALTSSFNALFTYNLISSPNLKSTIDNLGSMGYVSTATLVSSFNAIKKSLINIRSSIAYAGNTGEVTMQNYGDDSCLYFSTATVNFDRFSSFINSTSMLSFDANINVFFSGPLDSNNTGIYQITSYLLCKTNPANIMTSATYSDSLYAIYGVSNSYSRMITFDINRSFIQSNYTFNYNLVHYLSNNDSNTNTTFSTSASIYMSPINSLFFTVLKAEANI